MKGEDLDRLVADSAEVLLAGQGPFAVLGLTQVTLRLLERLRSLGLILSDVPVFVTAERATAQHLAGMKVLPMASLIKQTYGALAVASDEDKEVLLEAALPFIQGVPKVLVSGYSHLRFVDNAFERSLRDLLVPSFANGYPNTLVHLFQCLRNASRLGLCGAVVELGMFKGGTTVLLSRMVANLGQSWPVIGFDTFDGFPPRRSPLDMYEHPGCVFRGLDDVRRYTGLQGIEIVPGDIVETRERLRSESLVLTFFDTDNHTPAAAALEIVRERTLVGGSIVFDHFTGVDRFVYTLGERIAAKSLLDDSRYLNLHGTGVFYRQR